MYDEEKGMKYKFIDQQNYFKKRKRDIYKHKELNWVCYQLNNLVLQLTNKKNIKKKI